MGVYATERIGRKSLICTYKCLYGTSYSINSLLDSNFTLGWGVIRNKPTEILADGVTNPGIGRFLNSKPSSQANCQVLIGVTKSRIYIFMVSKDKIIEK
jgi:hypothetical protein